MTYLLITTILLNIMPGPAMFYVAQQALSRNSHAIMLSIIGIEFGTLLHIVVSSIGLTCLLAEWPAFTVISTNISAIFLIYLGISQLIKPTEITFSAPRGSVFLKGTLINTFNPKIILFFMSILPQFISSQTNTSWTQIVTIGLFFGLFGGLVNIILSLIVNVSIKTLQEPSNLSLIIKGLTRLISCLFIVAGILTYCYV